MVGNETHRRKKAREVLTKAGYRVGGHVRHADAREDAAMIKKGIREHETQLHDGKHARLHLKDGGCAEGEGGRKRGDRMARGGKKKGAKTVVNILLGHPEAHPNMAPMPHAAPVAEPMPPPVPVRRPMPPSGPPAGLAGGMLKKGGRVKPEAGAGSGLGREEKAREARR